MTRQHDRRQFLASSVVAAGFTATPATASTVATGRSSVTASILAFGARGDGMTDDTVAFERALASLPAGARLIVEGGHRFRLTRSLILQKPLIIDGGASDNTEILFDAGAYGTIGAQSAGVIIPHDLTTPRQGDGRRTTICGVTFRSVAGRCGPMHGVFIATPVYLYQVNALGFPADGFHVEASTAAVKGNANGSSFFNCQARMNGAAGFSFAGNDANSCVLVGARAFENAGDGFRDASLIGNVYLAGEAADNGGAGFWSDPEGPNASVYIGCFVETGQRYTVNPRNLVLGPLGPVSGSNQTMLSGSAKGAIAIGPEGLVIGGSSDVGSRSGGRFAACRLSLDGIEFGTGGGHSLQISSLLSTNYIDVLNDGVPVIRFPSRNVDSNVTKDRPWLTNGLSLGKSGRAALTGSGNRPPSEGTFDKGALWLNEEPAQGGYIGWACVTAGTPGTWRPFGLIA